MGFHFGTSRIAERRDHVGDQAHATARAERYTSRADRYSLIMSFWVVPRSLKRRRVRHPCSSATARYSASKPGLPVALIVIDVFIVLERDLLEQSVRISPR